jgi:transporter family-2 protein
MAAGVSLVVQVVMNTRLRVGLASWSWAGFVSYLGGSVSMAVLLLALREPLPSAVARAAVPWWGWIGGLFGAIYIVLAIILVPRLGAAMTVTLVVAGQMLGALAFDALGVMGIARQLPSPGRLLGALLLVAAVALMRT